MSRMLLVLWILFLYVGLSVCLDNGKPVSCIIHNCIACMSNVDCPSNYLCSTSNSTLINPIGFCYVEPLLAVFSWRKLVGSVLVFVAAIFASGTGGLGSGGLYISILIVVQNLRPAVAIGLTQAALFGSALAGFILFLRTPHPIFPEKCPFDYNTLLLLLPLTIVGSMLGIYVHLTCPTWFVLIFLLIVLIVAAYKSIAVVVARYESDAASITSEDGSVLDSAAVKKSTSYNLLIRATIPEAASERELLKPKSKITPARLRFALPGTTWKIVVICLLFLLAVLLAFLRSGRNGYSSITMQPVCSVYFWYLSLAQIPFYFLVTFIFAAILIREQSKNDTMLAIQDSEMIVTNAKAFLFPLAGLTLGLISSLIGFGGVILITPLFSGLGLHPLVLAGTSALVHLTTTGISLANFEVTGMLVEDYAVWFFVLALIGQFIGHLILYPWVKSLNNPKLVALVVCIIILAAAICLVTVGTIDILEDVRLSHNLTFHWFC